MKKLIAAALVAVTCAALAEEPRKGATVVTMTKEQEAAFQMRHFGGFVRRAGSGRGKVLVVNAQKRVSSADLAWGFDSVRRMMKLPVEVVDGARPERFGRAAVKATGANLVIWVVDDPKEESPMLVAPECGWAVVNTAALAEGASADALIDRAGREALRAFGYLCGAANSDLGRTIMGPMKSPADLDRFAIATYPADAYRRTLSYLERCGVEPYEETTYQAACQQGWAPQPTNEYQKAIWDKVHAIPSKPLKIEYNEKRDKGK